MNKIFVKDLKLKMSIGIYPREKAKKQNVLITIEGEFEDKYFPSNDVIEQAISYEEFVNTAKGLASKRHYNLVERYAEDIARECLKKTRIHTVRVRIEKPEVLKKTAAVGVEIVRHR